MHIFARHGVRQSADIADVCILNRTLRNALQLNGVPCSDLSSIHSQKFSTSSKEQHLLVSEKDGLGKITINRPKALNAKNCGMFLVMLVLLLQSRLSLTTL